MKAKSIRGNSTEEINIGIEECLADGYQPTPDFEVVDEVAASLGKLKSAIPDPDALLVYSCSARIDVLGPIINEEITAIYKLWNKPMAGFFCNGELARANNGDLEIHNLTAACVVLKEHSESGEI